MSQWISYLIYWIFNQGDLVFRRPSWKLRDVKQWFDNFRKSTKIWRSHNLYGLSSDLDTIAKLWEQILQKIIQKALVQEKSSLIPSSSALPQPALGEMYFHLREDEINCGVWSNWTYQGDLVPGLVKTSLRKLLQGAEKELSVKSQYAYDLLCTSL